MNEAPIVRLAVGVLPSHILLTAGPLASCESTFRRVERKLQMNSARLTPFPCKRETVLPIRNALRTKLGSAWALTAALSYTGEVVSGITLFIEEEGRWKPVTTYHVEAP